LSQKLKWVFIARVFYGGYHRHIKKLLEPMKIALLTGKLTDVTAGNYNDYAFITAAKNRGHEVHTLVSGQQSVLANPNDTALKASPLHFDALDCDQDF
jgi:polyphosphate kinase